LNGGAGSTPSASSTAESSHLFPYRVRPGQDRILSEVAEVAQRGGPLLINAPTGSGKTVATLAPLLEHAEAATRRYAEVLSQGLNRGLCYHQAQELAQPEWGQPPTLSGNSLPEPA